MAGRRPKPTKLKELEGNPGHRPLPEDEWEPEAGLPDKPRGLGVYGNRCWDRLSSHLEEIITEVDWIGFEMVCHAYQDWRVAEKENKPREVDAAFKRLRAMLIEFGLTPAARTKVQAGKSKKKDALQDFLSRGTSHGDGAKPN